MRICFELRWISQSFFFFVFVFFFRERERERFVQTGRENGGSAGSSGQMPANWLQRHVFRGQQSRRFMSIPRFGTLSLSLSFQILLFPSESFLLGSGFALALVNFARFQAFVCASATIPNRKGTCNSCRVQFIN